MQPNLFKSPARNLVLLDQAMKLTIVFLMLAIAFGARAEGSKNVPDCRLTLNNTDNLLSLGQHKGQVVYVDFWASWCPPCLKSFPFMNELHQQYTAKGLTVLAINLDDDRADADGFLVQTPHEFSIAFDNTDRDCAKAFDVKAMPSSYIVDRKGIIRHIHLGFKSEETALLRNQLEQLLAE